MIFFISYQAESLDAYIPRYRYFFNGQEADNEVYGEGILHAFEYRMHDTRIGRFWSVDPLAGKFPWNSPYAFAENRVVDGMELEGLEVVYYNNEFNSAFGLGKYGWNYSKGIGCAKDKFGVTFFHYKSPFKISSTESVAGTLLGSVKMHIGVDFSSRTFEQSIKKGAITSIDAMPFFGGSIDGRETFPYAGISFSIGAGVAMTTTDVKIEQSFSLSYQDIEKLNKQISKDFGEFKETNPDFSTYSKNGTNYLLYRKHGKFLNPFKISEIKTDIKVTNVGTVKNPHWQSEDYSSKSNND